jgi:hypothetical protein
LDLVQAVYWLALLAGKFAEVEGTKFKIQRYSANFGIAHVV